MISWEFERELKDSMSPMPLFHGNLGGKLEHSKSPMPGMLLFHGNLGVELEDLKFLTHRMLFFHENLGRKNGAF